MKRLNVPYIWQGSIPRCHVTSLSMILNYHGLKGNLSFLLNLSGLGYGFGYFEGGNEAIAAPESSMGIYPFIQYAAEKLGWTLRLLRNHSFEEAWDRVRHCIDEGKPVLLPLLNMKSLWKSDRPFPHVVVICGYDEKRSIAWAHDPALGRNGEGVCYLPPNKLQKGFSGCYVEYQTTDLKTAWVLEGTSWEAFGNNHLCVLERLSEEKKIPWEEVLQRNARLTLGMQEEIVGMRSPGLISGPRALRMLAQDFEDAFDRFDQRSAILHFVGSVRNMTFNVGASYRMQTSTFLSALASAWRMKELEEVAFLLHRSSLGFEQGRSEIDGLLTSQISQEEMHQRLQKISSILKEIADLEEESGTLMKDL
jgi:hypothetical protein